MQKDYQVATNECILFCTSLITERGKCLEVRQSGVLAASVLASLCADVANK